MRSSLLPPPPPVPEPVKITNPNRHPWLAKTILIISPILTITLLAYALGRDQISVLFTPPPPPAPTVYLSPTPTLGPSLYSGKKFTYPSPSQYSVLLKSRQYTLERVTSYPGYHPHPAEIGLFAKDLAGRTLINLGKTVMAPYIDQDSEKYISLAEQINDGIIFIGRTQIYFYSPSRSEIDLLFSDVEMSPSLSRLVFSPDKTQLFSVWSDKSHTRGKLLSINTSTKQVTIFPFQPFQPRYFKYISLARDLTLSQDSLTATIYPQVEPVVSPTRHKANSQADPHPPAKLIVIDLRTGEISYTAATDPVRKTP